MWLSARLKLSTVTGTGLHAVEAVVLQILTSADEIGAGKLSSCAVRESTKALASGSSYGVEYRFRRADGIYRWYLSRAEPLRDEDGQIAQWFGISVDVDERKRAEDQLRETRVKLARASRIATVAELSASIAHELNQPLTAVIANAQAARRWLSKQSTEFQ